MYVFKSVVFFGVWVSKWLVIEWINFWIVIVKEFEFIFVGVNFCGMMVYFLIIDFRIVCIILVIEEIIIVIYIIIVVLFVCFVVIVIYILIWIRLYIFIIKVFIGIII